MAAARSVTFADLLRRARRAAGLSQEALAERAGLSRTGISELERGLKRSPHKDTVVRLADALRLTDGERAAFEAAARPRISDDLVSQHSTALGLEAPTSFVGRARELARLERVLAHVGPPVLLFAGEPGIGKSRLLHEAAVRAHAAGWTVLVGGCQRSDRQAPYAPLVGALAQYLAHQAPARLRADLQGCAWLVRLLPELAERAMVPMPRLALPPEQERRLMFEAAARFLDNVAGPAGTLLALDDLQWAGADALDLLATLLRAGTRHPLQVVAAYRTTEVGPGDPLATLMTDLVRESRVAHVEVGPLSATEGADLLVSLMEVSTAAPLAQPEMPEMVERLLLRTGGVPYFLVSCAQELRAGEDLSTTVPWSIGQSIRTRVAALDPVAQEVLRAAAVIGRVVPHRLLAAMAAEEGIAERDLVLGLEVSGRARLLVAAEGAPHALAYQFAHDLVRDGILADLAPARQLALHRAAATALEQLPEPERRRRAAELAGHLLAGGEPRRALPFILQAGDDAETLYAHGDAERQYRAAVTIASELGDTRRLAEAQEKLGGVERLVARFEDALEAYRSAARAYAALRDPLAERRMTVQQAHTYESLGEWEQGKALLLPLLETSPSDEPKSTVADMYWTLAWLCDDPLERLAACARAATIARETGDQHMLAQAEFARANTFLTDLGRIGEAHQILESILPLLEASGDLRRLCSTLNLLALVSLHTGRFAAARDYAERALALAEQVSAPAQQAWTRCNRGTVAYHGGDWQQAYQDFERADAIYRRTYRMVDSAAARCGMGLVLLARGLIAQASPMLKEAIVFAEATAEQQVDTLRDAHAALAERDLVARDPRSACARLKRLLKRIQSRPGLVTPVLPLLAWAYLDLGDPDRATALTQDAIAGARAGPDHLVLVEALCVAGMVALRQERWSDTEIALDEALALCREMHYPYAEAKVLYVNGQLHTMRGEHARVHERFTAALAILHDLGERLYAERIDQAMSELDR